MKSQFTFLWLFLLMISASLGYSQTQFTPVAGQTESFDVSQGDFFYDPGGPGGSSTANTPGNYPNCGCVTLTTLNGVTEIEFLFFSVFATFDWLRIYDGDDTSGPVLFDNSSGGANSGDITLADMIDSNGSAIFTGTSGSLTFQFNSTTVVDYGGWEVEILAASGGGGGGGGDDSDVENDLCANAISLSCGQTITGTTAGSNFNTLPACNLAPYDGGIWYTIEGTGDEIEVSTCSASTNFDTQIAIFGGTCNNLSCIAGNNNDADCPSSRQSTVTFDSDAGTTYYIYVTGVAGARGNFGLTVSCLTPPTPGCTNTSAFATRAAPTSPIPVVISTLTWAGEYHTITGAIAGRTYAFTSSVTTDFLTVRQGTSSGPVIGTGTGAVSAIPTANGSIYVHINTSAACGTQNVGRTTTMACSSCVAVVGCANSTPWLTNPAPTTATPVTLTTCLFPQEYTTVTNALSTNSYTFTASVATNFFTVRQGTVTGPVIGTGTGSVTVTPTADNVNLYVHLNTNASCGTGTGCNTITAVCNTCVPPVSNDCAGAVALDCGDSVSGSTLDANVNDVPACGGLNASVAPGVWYSFTPSSNVEATLVACGDFNIALAVYSGSCSNLECEASSLESAPGKPCSGRNREAIAVFQAFAGETYYVYVTGAVGVGAAGDFTLSVASCEIFIENDNCANALPLACGQTITGSTVGASAATVPFCGTGLSTAPGVWYSFVGNGADATLSLCGSSYDTKIGIFTGTCGSLVCVGGNDDFCGLQSQRVVATTAGTTYYVYVTGFSSASGVFTLNLDCGALPCDCSNTASFGSANAPTTTSPVTITTLAWPTEYATISNAVAGQSYTFTSSVATDYITVRSGTPDGVALGCGTTPLTVTATQSGTIYMHLNLNSSCGVASTGFRTTTVACSSCAAPPPPVGCADAEAIACGDVVSGSTAGLPVNTTTPTCGTALGTAPAKWYSFTSTGTSVTVSLCGSGYDTKVGVFTGTCGNLTCVAGNDDSCGLQSEVTFASTVGTQYLVIVTGFGTGNGAYTLDISCTSTLDDDTASRSGENLEEEPIALSVGNFFPNPVTNNSVMIQIESPSNTEGKINVVDQTGRIVDSNKLFLGKGTNNTEVDVTKLPAGTYIATIVVDSEITQRKFVVIK